MTLPSSFGGGTTETVGLFHTDCDPLARWLEEVLGDNWTSRSLSVADLGELFAYLAPGGPVTRRVMLPIGEWTMMFTNGPRGTDVGVLPSHVARALHVTSIRATAVDAPSALYPATVLEVFHPDAKDNPQHSRRSVYAVNDGGTWRFGQGGEPYEFEDLSAYDRRLKRDRFTPEMLHRYLRELGVPIDDPLDISAAIVVELSEPGDTC